MLKLKGNNDLFELVSDGSVVGDEEKLCQLHGQRGGAAAMLAVADDIVPCPTDHAEVVDSAVLKEAAVFDGQHCLHNVLRNFIVSEQAALGAVDVFAEAGDEQRFKFIAGERLAVIVVIDCTTPEPMWMVAPSCA